MTLQQIVTEINTKNEWFMNGNFNFETAKLWSNYGKTRVYVGRDYVEIKDNKAISCDVVASQGFYERRVDFLDRMDSYRKLIRPIDVVARYIQIKMNQK